MASPLMGPPPQGQPKQPQPLTQAQSQFLPEELPQQVPDYIYEIDPQVLDRRVRIRIEASRRMNNRASIREMFQFMAPIVMNGQFLEMMAERGETVDAEEFFRMAEDASGTAGSYQLLRPFTPQEQQARQQPPPQLQAEQAQAQLEAQTRKEIMGMKVQADMQQTQMTTEAKLREIQEKAATEILKIMAQQRDAELQAAQGKDPQTRAIELQSKLQDAQLKAAQGQQKLELERQKAQMELQRSTLEHQMNIQQSQQSHQQSMQQGAESMQLEVLKQRMLQPNPGRKAQRSKDQEKPA